MNHLRTTLVALSAALASVLMIVSPVCGAPPAPVTCTPAPSVAPGWPLPPEAVPCDNPTPLTKSFASLSWQIFKMIVWPVAHSPAGEPIRGMPDTSRSLSDMHGPRVFETYKADWETFLPFAATPLDWPQYATTASACHNNPPIKPGTLVLSALAEFGNVNNLGQAITNILPAQNRKLTRYLVGFDKNEFDLIFAGQLYNSINLPAPGDPLGLKTAAPNGTIIVKSAWIELEGLAVPHDTFHRRHALVQDSETLDCKEVEVGLVALHIRYKTNDRPQWIWASFEHIQNVPPAADGTRPLRTSAAYTFNDGTGTPMPDQPPPSTLLGSPAFSPHASPFNVERVKPISDDIQSINTQWQSVLAGTVWANYQLVIVQWPVIGGSSGTNALDAVPDPPSITNSTDNLLNTTLETFLQKAAGPGRPPDGGLGFTCMGCHNAAQSMDYTFAIALSASNTRNMSPSPWRKQMIDYLTSLVTRAETRNNK